MIQRTKAILKQNGYELYSRPFEVNIVGFRANSTQSNAFDDEIHVFYKDDANRWQYWRFPATTDPGTYWLANPMMEKGTAILAQGQYVGAYGIGKHRGSYDALVQLHKPVTVIRDYDRDAILDFQNGNPDTGMHGINIHRAQPVGDTLKIERHSAGCQVFQNAEDFRAFLAMCQVHRARYGNSFTYTLIDHRARIRLTRKRAAMGLAIAGLAMIGANLLDDQAEPKRTPFLR